VTNQPALAPWLLTARIDALLRAIRNQPPGDIEEQFRGPGDPIFGGFRIEWWITEEQTLLMAALAVAETVQGVLERHTVEDIRNKILDTLKRKLDLFNWTPFVSIARGRVTTLRECAKPGATAAIVSALHTWATAIDKAIFIAPVRGMRPTSDFQTSTVLWASSAAPPELLNTVLQLPALPDTLSVYPPWLTGPTRGQQQLGGSDSLLGVVAAGWQAGVSQLRQVAGAICVALPDEQVSVRASPDWSNVFELSERGSQVLNAFGPILPWVANVKVARPPALDTLKALLASRADAERDRRFRISLEFLSTGWVLSGTQEFVNYFVALDALLGTSSGTWDKKTKTLVASRIQGHDPERRLQLTIRIRHELLHGRCSSVERSRWYLEYYRRYHVDPTEGLLHIVRQCLRKEPL